MTRASGERRKMFTAGIATRRWDGIIVTQCSFERIGMPRDCREKFSGSIEPLVNAEDRFHGQFSAEHDPSEHTPP